jgi:hypothetical protein
MRDKYWKAELRSQELQEFRMERPFRFVGDHSGEEAW